MNPGTKNSLLKTFLAAALVLSAPLTSGLGSAWAAVQYLGDGALQNSQGGWNLPTQGSCPADPTQTTRPACLALRLNFDSVTCPATNLRSWTTNGVCNDLINTTQPQCEAAPDRLWNAATGICAVVMQGDDRNNVVCAQHQGTWVLTGACIGVWVFPNSSTYTPPLFTGTTNPGPGDQCLRCHNSVTEYNGPRLRDVDWFLRTGHKNMSRKVTPGMPWAGPGYECSNPIFTTSESCVDNGGTWDRTLVIYPSDDSGNPFDWTTGRVGICTNSAYKNATDCAGNGGTWNDYDMTWIYADWLTPLPREIFRGPASTSQVCSDPRGNASNCTGTFGGTMINNAGASYSCARCHTTGWTSDAAIGPSTGNLAKEPEKSFPGITWDRNTNAPPNVVNLSGGVLNDPNKYASWDYWGIVCARCHSSAVDNTTNGGVPPYSAPAGMSSHHSNLTTADSASGAGYCTESRFTAQTQCDAAGGAWLTACSLAGVCSNPSFTTSGTCVGGGGVWTKYDTQLLCLSNGQTWYGTGCVGDATLTTQAACLGASKTWFGPGCTNPTFTTQTTCEGANEVWSDSRCSVAGICNNPIYTDATTCKTNGFYWAATTDIIRCEDADGRWTGSKANRGQIITRLCMDCHRQETAGVPYANASATAGTYDTVNPGLYLKVGPVHGTFDFISHPHGPMFLNSPHGKFTGTFNQINLGTFSFDMTGLYKSFFQIEGEAANTGNGCTGCHDVHKSTVEEAFEPLPEQEGAIKEVCTTCHSGPFAKDLTKINHLPGPGTPLEEMEDGEDWETCVSCHMPEGQHLFRINTDPAYSTFPAAAITATSSAQCTAAGGTWSSSTGCTVNANTAPEGSFTNATWVDLDYACGQCHGGGTGQATTTGTTVAGSKTLTVASSAGFQAGQRVRVTDAGALGYDDEGLGRGDFDTFIVSVPDATHLNLIGAPTLAVSGKAVVQNATKNGAPYYTKAQLAPVAQGMHDSAGITYSINYTSAVVPNSLTVNVDATVTCGGPCPPFLYDWDWGDGTAHGTTDPGSHTFAIAGTKSILLTVRLQSNGLSVGSYGRNVTIANPDLPPTVDGTCTWNGDTWTMNVLDSSSDDAGDGDTLPPDGNATLRIVIDWGDGSLKTFTSPGASVNHLYTKTGTFVVTQKGVDSKLQTVTRTCPVSATPGYFAIGGTVKNSGATANLAAATVQVKKGALVMKTIYTAADGTFSTGNTLKPGTYDLVVTKSGYTFALPAATLVIGPSSTGNLIVATGPPSFAQPTTVNKPRIIE
jgi:predicted CXXCH cytochrome family protein